ncbi:MAG: carbohydrate kinase family protein [Actinomycetota bacterium]
MLCTIGDLIEDVVVWLNDELNIGSDADSVIVRTRGGSAANVAMFGALTGTPSRFIGQVGNDNLGEQLCASLRGSGVDVCTVAEGRTGSIVVVVQPNGERTFLTDRGVASELSLFDASHLTGVSIVHVPTYSLALDPLATTAIHYIRAARAAGVLISIDASSTSVLRDYGIDRYAELIASIAPDVFLCNNDEAALLNIDSAHPMTGAALTVIKRGALPVTTVTAAGVVTEVATPPVTNIVDTTGAGDAFAAGFLPVYAASRNIEDAITNGNLIAARVLRSPGATLDAR